MNLSIKSISEKLFKKKDGDYHKVFIYLAGKANQFGELETSRNSISIDCNISQSKTERILNFLKSEQQIEQVNKHTNRLIKVLYKDVRKKTEQQTEQPKTLFTKIKNFSEFRETYTGNKQYLTIAYGFWKLWKKHYPTHKTLSKSEVNTWVKDVDDLLNKKGNSIERLVAVYCYFKMAKNGIAGYDPYWFKRIMSISAFGKTSSLGKTFIEHCADIEFEKREKDLEFNSMVEQTIKIILAL